MTTRVRSSVAVSELWPREATGGTFIMDAMCGVTTVTHNHELHERGKIHLGDKVQGSKLLHHVC